MDEEVFDNLPEETEEFAPPEIHFCVMSVGSNRYTIPIEAVREITDALAVVPLPGSPDHVKGLIHLRGEVIPVIDLGSIVHAPYNPQEEKKMVIMESRGEPIGLLVDGMPDLVESAEGDVINVQTFFEETRVK